MTTLYPKKTIIVTGGGGAPPAIPFEPDTAGGKVDVSPSVPELKPVAEQGVNVTPAVDKLEVPLVSQGVNVTPSLDTAIQVADQGVNATPSLEVAIPVTDQRVDVAPTIDTFKAELAQQQVNIAPTIDSMAPVLTGPTVSITRSLQMKTSPILATKDSWVPTAKVVGNCVDDANKDGQDLKVSSVVEDNDARAIFGFDLTQFPSNATVTAANLYLKPTAAALNVNDIRLVNIAAGDEGWSESTVKCSNIPADGATTTSFEAPTAATEIVVNLSAFLSYIQGRMGSANTCSFKLNEFTVVPVGRTFESADQGVNDSLGPRLEVTFTVPA